MPEPISGGRKYGIFRDALSAARLLTYASDMQSAVSKANRLAESERVVITVADFRGQVVYTRTPQIQWRGYAK